MGIAYKNFWSLNTDEAVVTGILRNEFSKNKNIEVFMPLNAQMKDIDLILMNMKKEPKKAVTIQVKGSRAYEPSKMGVKKYVDGSGGWFWFDKKVISESSADYFIFLIYVLETNHNAGRRNIKPHTLTIPTKELQNLCNKYEKEEKGNKYNFFFWVNPVKKEAFDIRNEKKIYPVSEYLDDKGFELLHKQLTNSNKL